MPSKPSRSDLFAHKAVLGRVWARFSEQQNRLMAHIDRREPLPEGRVEAVKNWLRLALLHRWMRDFALAEASLSPEIDPDEEAATAPPASPASTGHSGASAEGASAEGASAEGAHAPQAEKEEADESGDRYEANPCDTCGMYHRADDTQAEKEEADEFVDEHADSYGTHGDAYGRRPGEGDMP